MSALSLGGAEVNWKEGELPSIWELYTIDLYKQLEVPDPTLTSIILPKLSSGADPEFLLIKRDNLDVR